MPFSPPVFYREAREFCIINDAIRLVAAAHGLVTPDNRLGRSVLYPERHSDMNCDSTLHTSKVRDSAV